MRELRSKKYQNERNLQTEYNARIFRSFDELRKFIIHHGLEKYQLICLYGGKKYGKDAKD